MTFLRSKLDWSELDDEAHRAHLDWYRALIALRRAHPDLSDPRLERVRVEHGETWLVVHRGALRVAANLSPIPLNIRLAPGQILLASDPGVHFGDAPPSSGPDGEASVPGLSDLVLPAHSLAVIRPDGSGL